MDHLPIILFDFDGVILTQKALEYAALIHLRRDYGWQNTENMRLIDFAKIFELSDTEKWLKSLTNIHHAYKRYIPKRWKRILYFTRFNRDFQKYEKIYESLKPNLEGVLNKLKNNNFPLGIVSNTAGRRLNYFKKKLNLEQYFTVFISRDDYRFNKPHPYPIIMALKLIKDKFNFPRIDKQNVYFIGDLPTDIQCGRAANVNTIALLSGHGTKLELRKSNPTFMLNDHNELLEIEPFKKLLLK